MTTPSLRGRAEAIHLHHQRNLCNTVTLRLPRDVLDVVSRAGALERTFPTGPIKGAGEPMTAPDATAFPRKPAVWSIADETRHAERDQGHELIANGLTSPPGRGGVDQSEPRALAGASATKRHGVVVKGNPLPMRSAVGLTRSSRVWRDSHRARAYDVQHIHSGRGISCRRPSWRARRERGHVRGDGAQAWDRCARSEGARVRHVRRQTAQVAPRAEGTDPLRQARGSRESGTRWPSCLRRPAVGRFA